MHCAIKDSILFPTTRGAVDSNLEAHFHVCNLTATTDLGTCLINDSTSGLDGAIIGSSVTTSSSSTDSHILHTGSTRTVTHWTEGIEIGQ